MRMTHRICRSLLGVLLPALVITSTTLALQFLSGANQARSTFKLDGVKNDKGTQVATVRFTEKPAAERLVQSPENAPAIGRLWIDSASGTVRQTEIGFGGKTSNMHAT